MANENEEKRETLADIAAEIRAYGDRPPPKCAWLDIAERIEAIDSADAWRSLYTPGNAAAMREALVAVKKSIDGIGESSLDCAPTILMAALTQVCARLSARIERALSVPPRNCDVGTAEEQEKRYKLKREVYHTLTLTNALAWAQMPYAEEGAVK